MVSQDSQCRECSPAGNVGLGRSICRTPMKSGDPQNLDEVGACPGCVVAAVGVVLFTDSAGHDTNPVRRHSADNTWGGMSVYGLSQGARGAGNPSSCSPGWFEPASMLCEAIEP